MANERFQRPVFCSTATALFDDFTEAVEADFAATEKLISLAGQHEAFAEFRKSTDAARAKSRAARQALEQHWEEHGCRAQPGE